mgnify:CR=1 FL=1
MIAEHHKPRIVLGASIVLFLIIVLGWKYTQRDRGAELTDAVRTNFISDVFSRGAASANAFQEQAHVASTTASSTSDLDLNEPDLAPQGRGIWAGSLRGEPAPRVNFQSPSSPSPEWTVYSGERNK